MNNIVVVDDPTTDIECGMRVEGRWEDLADGLSPSPCSSPRSAR